MLKAVVICGTGAVASVLAAQMVINFDNRSNGTAMAAVARQSAPAAPAAPASPGTRVAQVAKSADGHYWAEASVNGKRIRFLVDTGATAVALTPDDALRLGFDSSELIYGHKVMTASGEARAAKVQLEAVSVAGARVDDVEAFVIEDGLDTSLLGMTYLGRLERFEATRTALILRP